MDSFQTKEKVHVLFLDVSSTCTGYSIAEVDFLHRKAEIVKAGALWFNTSWSHAEKYYYIQKAIENYFWIIEKIDYIVHETYSINPNNMMGVMVVPEMIGAIKAGAQENNTKVDSILPQSWRSVLKVKAEIIVDEEGKPKLKNKGKAVKDYKKPTKTAILKHTNIPDKVVSNITKKMRATPSDIYDAIGVGYGWLSKLKGAEDSTFLRSVNISKDININPHIGYDDI